MKNIINKILTVFAIALIPAFVLFPRGPEFKTENGFRAGLEVYVKDNFPFVSQLSGFEVMLKAIGGQREYNGVFVGEQTLIKNTHQPITEIVNKNTEAVSEIAKYSRAIDKQVYFSLIPTASEISKSSAPMFADIFNQRTFIDDIYSRFAGKLVTVDAYFALYSARDQYNFYRTEDNLTAIGGYNVYTALLKRMLNIENSTYNHFDLVYSGNDYYGELYTGLQSMNIRPDSLMLLEYSNENKEYMVTHKNETEIKTYHTLFPAHKKELGSEMDIYLGGLSPVIDIKVSMQETRQLDLLIFGDKTALSYLPLLANHYGHITFVDLSYVKFDYSDIKIEQYDQVLIIYSVETFISECGLTEYVGEDMQYSLYN